MYVCRYAELKFISLFIFSWLKIDWSLMMIRPLVFTCISSWIQQYNLRSLNCFSTEHINNIWNVHTILILTSFRKLTTLLYPHNPIIMFDCSILTAIRLLGLTHLISRSFLYKLFRNTYSSLYCACDDETFINQLLRRQSWDQDHPQIKLIRFNQLSIPVPGHVVVICQGRQCWVFLEQIQTWGLIILFVIFGMT